MTINKTAITDLMADMPHDVQYAHFDGVEGSRELSFTIGPATAEQMPVHLNVRGYSEYRETFRQIKKPNWKYSCTVTDNYGGVETYNN